MYRKAVRDTVIKRFQAWKSEHRLTQEQDQSHTLKMKRRFERLETALQEDQEQNEDRRKRARAL